MDIAVGGRAARVSANRNREIEYSSMVRLALASWRFVAYAVSLSRLLQSKVRFEKRDSQPWALLFFIEMRVF